MALVQDTVKQPSMCAQRLAVEALARGGGDNVAVAVLFLGGHGTTGACGLTGRQGARRASARGCMAKRRAAGRAAPPQVSLRLLTRLAALSFPAPAAAERVYHAGQLKYHSAAAAKRTAGPGLSADELRDTY